MSLASVTRSLNTMFRQASTWRVSTACLDRKQCRVAAIKNEHASFGRLMDAAKAAGVSGAATLARALNVSPQVVTNWKGRGVSQDGALLAERAFGCSASYILDGKAAGATKGTAAKAPVVVESSSELNIPAPIRQLLDDLADLPPAKQSRIIESIHQEAEEARAAADHLSKRRTPSVPERKPGARSSVSAPIPQAGDGNPKQGFFVWEMGLGE